MLDKPESTHPTTIRLWDGREIPRLGMGCWAIGGPLYAGETPLGYGKVDDRESIAAIRRAVEFGVRFFDPADVYGAGHSEEILGHAIGGRDDVVIATKLGNRFDPATRQLTGSIAEGDLVRETRAAIEASLRRLKRERIDLAQLHLNSFPTEQATVVFDTLDLLESEGKVGAYGWSTDFPERALSQAKRDNFVAVQHGMNVFFDAPSLFAVIETNDLISINRSPLAMGVLTAKFPAGDIGLEDDVRQNDFAWMDYFKGGRVAPDIADRVTRIRHLLSSNGRTPAQGALGWLLAKSPRTLPIPGFRNAAQVEDNVGALAKGPLPADVMDEIERLIDRAPEGPPRER